MNPDEVLKLSLEDFVERVAVNGAMMSDKEWDELRDQTIDSFREALNVGRSGVRMKIMQTMFRTDEEE